MSEQAPALSVLLTKLEQELKAVGLWSTEQPSSQALASTQPFCCDTLSFEQWLQFIFIPRISQMLAARQQLPSAIAITPMGEEAFKSLGDKAANLINTLGAVDQLLSGQRLQTQFTH
jgi:dTDP-4-dehydrorhamnose 3,5-epimerase